jgi:ferritin-like metal-binding protein YciE
MVEVKEIRNLWHDSREDKNVPGRQTLHASPHSTLTSSLIKMKTLKDLFLDELADMYDAENRIVKALPDLAGAATNPDLKKAFEDHLVETQGHVSKLEQVFKCFDEEVRGKKCEATVGLLKEGDEITSDFKGSPAINAALISAGQKVEHYEIASYGCLREWALMLDNQEAADLIQEILEQEETANQTLTGIAESEANEEALGDLDIETSLSGDDRDKQGVPAGVGGQPENDEDARAAGIKSATDTKPARK